MSRNLLFLLLLLVASLASASDANEVLRTPADTYKQLHLAKNQVTMLEKIDGKFGTLLAKLRKEKPNDYLAKRDALNEKYTREFTGAMNIIQKSSYRKYVRSLRQAYMKAHPDVDGDNIFIWGAANLL
jgi:hypothetical protein